MKKRLAFCMVHGAAGVLLGCGILEFFKGPHSHMPLTEGMIFSFILMVALYFLSNRMKNDTTFRVFLSVWLTFTAVVVVVAEITDHIRFHHYIGYPEKFDYKFFLYDVPSMYFKASLFISPIFYLSTLFYKFVESRVGGDSNQQLNHRHDRP